MPALPQLSKMSDGDYKKMSPEELMMYNKDLPTQNYETPYCPEEHPFPKHLYKPQLIAGVNQLTSALCENAEDFAGMLKDGWKESPADFNVETAPQAPRIKAAGFSVAMPMPETLSLPKK